MRYLLDSDAVTFFYDDRRQPQHKALHDRIASLEDTDVLETSALVLCEFEYSYWNAPEEKRDSIRRTISSLEEDFETIRPVDRQVASVFGELKARLGRERNVGRKEMRRHNVDRLLASSAVTDRPNPATHVRHNPATHKWPSRDLGDGLIISLLRCSRKAQAVDGAEPAVGAPSGAPLT